jgi:hypothetical protein
MTGRTKIVLAGVAATAEVLGLVAVLVTSRGSRTEPAPTSATPASSSAGTTNLLVYFHRGTPGDPAKVVAVPRSVPGTAAVATAALNELLPGPTAAERVDGHWSMFVPGTARSLKSVRVADGVAYVDFRNTIPNASSSFGSTALLAELDTTLRQFPTVKSTVYSFDGDVTSFYQEIRHRLTVLGSAHRWQVRVHAGRVSIVDSMDDAADRHVAEVLARAVAGVTDVRITTPERI